MKFIQNPESFSEDFLLLRNATKKEGFVLASDIWVKQGFVEPRFSVALHELQRQTPGEKYFKNV